jgi:excisionase family DNA binding protein
MKKRSPRWEEVMTMEEVERYLRVTRKTIAAMVRVGRLPGVKVGRSFRFLKEELDRFLAGTRKRRAAAPRRSERSAPPPPRPPRRPRRPALARTAEEIYVVE